MEAQGLWRLAVPHASSSAAPLESPFISMQRISASDAALFLVGDLTENPKP